MRADREHYIPRILGPQAVLVLLTSLAVLGTANRCPSHLRPVDVGLDLLVDKSNNAHIVAPHDVETQRYLLGVFGIIVGTDDSFHSTR